MKKISNLVLVICALTFIQIIIGGALIVFGIQNNNIIAGMFGLYLIADNTYYFVNAINDFKVILKRR